MAGYSGTPLPKKLGIKSGARVALVGKPAGFSLGDLPDGVDLREDVRGRSKFDVIVFFAPSSALLRRRFAALAGRIEQNGGLWIGWPKKSSGVETDLSDGAVREAGLGAGLVDNKTCAIDETWSGLRFVIRLENRTR